MVSVSALFVALSLAGSAFSQSSTASDFTIQTSPASESASDSNTSGGADSTALASITSALTNNASSSASSTGSGSSAASSASAVAGFPDSCGSQCNNISTSLSTCGVGTSLNTTCLCTDSVEAAYKDCLECALGLSPAETTRASYQEILDTFISQCALASTSPVTLPSATITYPASVNTSTLAPLTTSNGSSATANSSSTSSSSSSSGSSSSLAVSTTSGGSAATSSAATSAASSGSSSGARRSLFPEEGLLGLGLGVVGLLGGLLLV
ncbi:hypothetical protein L202_05785 [Cryptococcus amylolentus CBS 6039]|uniref:Extracellular membrane protein CFEM domain-containing protein n=2 Tax=Cryptococcus amylolentus TaxID=104669 RepID=A0A1E3HHF3_9TREE|nr:hypothetical protein L202_05785 [Cryptococcus amylolentus CBS 6039]ODN75777.1 hypothetical protein L202_05785 [Cryptococcus amylolentus CBS 6039]ODN96947.1 hypothetical protein I350_07922 [Cryptococcus amylolentus CBS 6273]